MVIKDGKIVEATEQEMFAVWLDQEWDDIFSFPDWLDRCKRLGVKIKEDQNENQSH